MPQLRMCISVVITCFNEGAYIESAVRSVLDQTGSGLIEKIVVIDDGSDPDTLAVLDGIVRLDSRIEIIRENGNGLPLNRNIATERVTSEWIAFLDGDDIWLPGKLQRQWDCVGAHQEIGLVYTQYLQFRDGQIDDIEVPRVRDLTQSEDTELDYFRFDGPIIPSTVMIRRSVFESVGRFDPAVKVFEDTELFARVASVSRFAMVGEPLLMKRVHAKAITSRRSQLMAHHAYVAFLIASRSPRLLSFVPRRLADRARKLGNVEISLSNRSEALRYYGLAARLRPFSLSIWLLLVATFLRFPLRELRSWFTRRNRRFETAEGSG